MEKLLDIRNLRTEFYSDGLVVPAVQDISFTLHKGETVGIVGESGSGKSVTSLSILRLIPDPPGRITGGEILYNSRDKGGVDLLKLPPKEMRKLRGKEISMIFQEPMTSLNPVFTCGAQVMEALLIHEKISRKQAKERTIRLFEKVKLPRPEAIFDSYPHQLSGGQKQRVMIAMAISCNPSVLIADEPTTALDVTIQKTILELLKQLQEEYRMGMIFITHDLGVIAGLADRVIVMYKGKIVEEGPVQEIFDRPQHPYTKGLLACRPPLGRRLKLLPTVSDFMEIGENGVIREKEKNITDVIASASVSPEERTEDHKKLYAREPVLRVENLKTWFPVRKGLFGGTTGHVKAVDDVSFAVYPGETLGLVGESGCGKTTLGRTVLRLIEPTSGRVWFDGKDLAAISASAMRQVRKDLQIIFQDPYSSLNPRMMIGEAIAEPMKVHKLYPGSQCREKTMELLAKVGLQEDHYYRYPHEFSGGQRQRIVIARALALNPRFIICDESVSALDVSVQAQVLNLLNRLKKEFGFTYIFISHDLGVVKFMSDRMIVMNKGKIEEMGDPDEIYSDPKTEYTRRLIEAIPKV